MKITHDADYDDPNLMVLDRKSTTSLYLGYVLLEGGVNRSFSVAYATMLDGHFTLYHGCSGIANKSPTDECTLFGIAHSRREAEQRTHDILVTRFKQLKKLSACTLEDRTQQ